jgi:hypothetical protein
MKNAEGVALASELDRRLKASTDQLRDVRETLEQLGRSAGALQRLFGVEQIQEAARAKGWSPKEQTATELPPTRSARPAPAAPAPQDEIPEWRRVFPNLSTKVPGRGK